MSALTRILNNQIYNQTIIASQKIQPGSITGTLFASNVTVPGDFLITGNLFVLGSSQTTTVASTNTYVNDPLIVLNNGFSGSNTYDEGFIFNRGSGQNKAFIWNEFNGEFRLLSTTEDGTTYGNINQASFANVRLGNLFVQYDITSKSLTTSGDVAVNGGDLTTTAATFNLLDQSTAVTVNFAKSANITLGATVGTTTIQNPVLVGSQTTQAVYNTVATTVNAFGAATTLNLAAATGATTINNQTNVIGVLYANSTGVSTNSTSGGIVAAGGLGVGGSIYAALSMNAPRANVTGGIDSTSTTTGAVVVTGGVGISANLFVGGDATVIGNLTVLGNTIAVASNNLVVSDSIIELHYVNGGNITVNDGRDIGLRMHFNRGAGNDNAALVLANDTGYLEWYGTGVQETSNINIAGTYGTIKSGNLVLVGNIGGVTSTNFNNGALVAGGGIGVLGNVNLQRNGRLTLGLDILSNTVYADTPVQFVTSANSFSRVSIQNTSSGQKASSDFIAMADTGSNVADYIVTGIASSTFNSAVIAPVIQPKDGYTFTSTANLVISAAKDLVFSANGLSDVSVRISKDFNNVGVQSGRLSSSELDGAFTVIGSAGFYGNINVGLGATFNTRQNNYANAKVVIKGVADPTLFVAIPGADSIVINGQGNALPQLGTSAKFGGNGAIVVPVGTSSQRPGTAGNVDVAGMVRFNSTTNALEYYDGSAWQIAGSVFTVISDRQFSGNVAGGYGNVDGTNTQFTLQSNATTSSTIVSINGILQFPVLAYSVSGATLEFTEPPAPNDVIDARILTTTSTISTVASGSGLNQFIADDNGASIYTGTSVTTQRVLVDPVGDINILTGSDITYTQTAVNIAANNTPYVIATRSQTGFTSAKYIVTAKRGTGATGNVETYEAQVITDGDGNAYISTYGVTNNGYAMGVLSANVLAGNVQVYYTGVIASSVVQANVKCFGTYIL